MTIKKRNAVTGYLFISLWIIGFLFFTLYPTIYSMKLSTNELQITVDGILMKFKGLYYFNEAINVDTAFKISLTDTITFIGCATPIIIVFALIIALMLNRKFYGRSFFRGLFFLPVIIFSGPVISELLTEYIVGIDANPVILSFINGLPSMIKKPILFSLQNFIFILWFSGAQILIFLAGLQKIGSEVYEAASIDGASAWEKFWKITLPFMKPFALVNSIYTVMEIANYSYNSVNRKIASHLLEVNRPYSFSAAMSWIYFGVVLGILLLVYLIFRGFGRRDKD